jgi:hypothetical protein
MVQARFVVLTPASESDSSVVIATGNAPDMHSQVAGGLLARVWESSSASIRSDPALSSDAGVAIVRVVGKENGWTVPRNAERRKRLETIHPGPKLANG